VIAANTAIVSTSINEKTQKTIAVSTNENGNQRKKLWCLLSKRLYHKKHFSCPPNLTSTVNAKAASKNE